MPPLVCSVQYVHYKFRGKSDQDLNSIVCMIYENKCILCFFLQYSVILTFMWTKYCGGIFVGLITMATIEHFASTRYRWVSGFTILADG